MSPPDRSLPHFAERDYEKVLRLVSEILTARHTEHTALIELKKFQDGHFRAIFQPSYFTIADGQEQPSKSQWNTLKKKFKRHDRKIFVFKEHGIIRKKGSSPDFYIDFGFFAA